MCAFLYLGCFGLKTIELTEEQLFDLSEIEKELFIDEHAPRSTAYVRRLMRPSKNWFGICISIFSSIMLLAVFEAAFCNLGVPLIACMITVEMLLLIRLLFL